LARALADVRGPAERQGAIGWRRRTWLGLFKPELPRGAIQLIAAEGIGCWRKEIAAE
jgi:hypothetical protein